MNPNKKLYGTHLIASQSESKFEPRSLKSKRKKIVIEKLIQNRDRIFGIPTKYEKYKCNPNFIAESENRDKFKRTPSPNKAPNRSSSISPNKVHKGSTSDNYMRILRRNYSQHRFNPLSISKTERSDMPLLKQQGFINKYGQLNTTFILRLQNILSHGSADMYPQVPSAQKK